MSVFNCVYMKENIFVVGLFFIFAPLLIFSQAYLLAHYTVSSGTTYAPVESKLVSRENSGGVRSIFSSREVVGSELKSSVIASDSRPILIKKYLQNYNSELEPYSDLIYEVSQKKGLDYRLIVAIAQQESNLCKKAPKNCFNCWGVGIHSRGRMCFDSYNEAIKWMGNYLKEEYYDKGINSVEGMMEKYCPLSSGSWAAGVRQFMAEIDKNG